MNSFFSKILLFGEYGAIHGSDALAIPFDNFSGELTFDRNNDFKSNRDLKSFSQYLKKYSNIDSKYLLDIQAFEFDVGQGLVFKSTIPQGYGLGSSGALCASVFDKYLIKKINRSDYFSSEELISLRKVFGMMESHFHGKSSGIEPLISYISRPLYFKDSTEIQTVKLPQSNEFKFFIVDTGRGRSTEPLVNLYLEKLKVDSFREICEMSLKNITNSCIKAFLSSNSKDLFGLFTELSFIQSQSFMPMIPPLYRSIWLEGLEGDLFRFKLCGAGGGGFLLGLTSDIEAFKSKYPNESIRVLNI